MSLRIGDKSVDPKEAIEISVKIGKMTSIVRPQSSKKVAVRTDGPSAEASGSRPRQSESQQRNGTRVVGPDGEELGHVGGGDDLTQHPPPPSSFASTTKPPGGYGSQSSYVDSASQFNYPQSQSQYQQAQSSDYRINAQPYYLDRNQPEVISNALKPVTTYNVLVGADENGDGGEVQAIEKEKLTKAWKFGSSWLPIDDEDGLVADKFETEMGLDLYKFVKANDVSRFTSLLAPGVSRLTPLCVHSYQFDREFEMGEVRYVFPDPSSTKAQVQLSSLVQAMVAHPKGEHYAIFRFCYSTNADPHLCVARAVIVERQQYLQFVQVSSVSLSCSFCYFLLPETLTVDTAYAAAFRGRLPTRLLQLARERPQSHWRTHLCPLDDPDGRAEGGDRQPRGCDGHVDHRRRRWPVL